MNASDLFRIYAKNLDNFFSRLPPTSIKFIWRASEQTWLSSTARSLQMNASEYFIHESSKLKERFYYVYNNRHIQYLLRAYQVQSEPVILSNVAIISRHASRSSLPDIANQGDHLTFGITLMRGGFIKTETHFTTYTHDVDDANIISVSHSMPCNFNFEDKNIRNFNTLQAVKCFNYPLYSIKTVFDKNNQHIIHKLCKEALTEKKPLPSPGGASFFGQYKGVNYNSKEFTNLIEDQFFLKATPYESFLMMYDENESSPHIICFIETSSSSGYIIYVHVKRVMKAAYARANLETCSKGERACLDKMYNSFKNVTKIIMDGQ